jgi:hypothetical protein
VAGMWYSGEFYSRAGFYIYLKSQFHMAIIVNYSPTFLMVRELCSNGSLLGYVSTYCLSCRG